MIKILKYGKPYIVLLICAVMFASCGQNSADYKQLQAENDSLKLENAKSSKQARNLITSNMDNFNDILAEEMKDKEYSYTIDYGMHPFPEKKYKGITYEAGEYESLLVTLGSGEGDNWWCVLFPPLCLLEAEETTNTSDIEYKSFIKEIIEKYF